MSKQIQINNIIYESVKVAAIELNIKEDKIRYQLAMDPLNCFLINKDLSKHIKSERKPRQSKKPQVKVVVDNIQYDNLSQASIITGIKVNTIISRMHRYPDQYYRLDSSGNKIACTPAKKYKARIGPKSNTSAARKPALKSAPVNINNTTCIIDIKGVTGCTPGSPISHEVYHRYIKSTSASTKSITAKLKS